MSEKFMIGIDEAGRGPLAGPIALGAFAIRASEALELFANVKESKQLSPEKREEWFAKIETEMNKGIVCYSVSFSSEAYIDSYGLTRAVNRALDSCLKKLENCGFCTSQSQILLDGLLKAKPQYKNQKTIIGGDESEPLIALASICAKVLRDRKMNKLAKLYPQYGFDEHKGYGTKKHFAALRSFGISPIHRKTFLNKFVLLNGSVT